MNKLNRIQTGGFPLSAERLQEGEDAYGIFNALGEAVGNKSIISGCEVVGSNTTNGVVYIDNEVFEFRGGQTQTRVKVLQEAIEREFQNGQTREIYYKRYVTFASGTGSIPWSEFSRPFSMLSITSRITELEKQNAVFQANGAMVLWNKPAVDIPTGWQEVVNWRGRIPVGLHPTDNDFKPVGKTGGQKMKQLVEAELPRISPIPPSSFKKGSAFGGSGGLTRADYPGASFGSGELIQPFGGDQPFSLMNPYRVVMFIEYIG